MSLTNQGNVRYAWDGRLENVRGVGSRRITGIRNALTALLGKARRQPRIEAAQEPPVNMLLGTDREYRRKAEQGALALIAPKRFNTDGKAWLPILHTHRDEWHFTLLYSNTALAHELKRTHDWVVVYLYDDHHQEGQCTVVTETRGPLTGLLVVRGRELECRDYYATEAQHNPAT